MFCVTKFNAVSSLAFMFSFSVSEISITQVEVIRLNSETYKTSIFLSILGIKLTVSKLNETEVYSCDLFA